MGQRRARRGTELRLQHLQQPVQQLQQQEQLLGAHDPAARGRLGGAAARGHQPIQQRLGHREQRLPKNHALGQHRRAGLELVAPGGQHLLRRQLARQRVAQRRDAGHRHAHVASLGAQFDARDSRRSPRQRQCGGVAIWQDDLQHHHAPWAVCAARHQRPGLWGRLAGHHQRGQWQPAQLHRAQLGAREHVDRGHLELQPGGGPAAQHRQPTPLAAVHAALRRQQPLHPQRCGATGRPLRPGAGGQRHEHPPWRHWRQPQPLGAQATQLGQQPGQPHQPELERGASGHQHPIQHRELPLLDQKLLRRERRHGPARQHPTRPAGRHPGASQIHHHRLGKQTVRRLGQRVCLGHPAGQLEPKRHRHLAASGPEQAHRPRQPVGELEPHQNQLHQRLQRLGHPAQHHRQQRGCDGELSA